MALKAGTLVRRDSGSAPPRVDVKEPEPGGGGSGWVHLYRARNEIEAHLLIGRLTEAGIESSTLRDRSSPGDWLYGASNPWVRVSVMVRRVQLDDARIVLAEIAYENDPANKP